MRILVVDDDYVSRMKLKALFNNYGDCDAAPDGETAIRMFVKGHEEGVPYDLVTMDIDMPDMRGQDVVKKIRDWEAANMVHMANHEAKILMVTVMNNIRDILSSFRKGCEWYLAKPVTPENVKEAMLQLEIE